MSEFENNDTVWERERKITICRGKDGMWSYHYYNGRGAYVSSYSSYESLELCCNRLIDKFKPNRRQINE